jgi:hypothetical protein
VLHVVHDDAIHAGGIMSILFSASVCLFNNFCGA